MNLWVRKPQTWEYCKNMSKETRRCQNIHSVHVECVIHGAFCHDSPNGISFRREWKIRGNVESKKQMTEMILEYWNVSQLRKQKEIQNLTITRAFVYSRRKTTYMAYNWLTGRLAGWQSREYQAVYITDLAWLNSNQKKHWQWKVLLHALWGFVSKTLALLWNTPRFWHRSCSWFKG